MKSVIKVYTDGSYSSKNDIVGYGCVAVHEEAPLFALCGLVKEPELNTYRNITGEIVGVARGLISVKNLIEAQGLSAKVVIVHDYNGISQWATERWNTNNVLTKNYAKWFKEISKDIEIDFLKVKGHSGNRWNDVADSLSRECLTGNIDEWNSEVTSLSSLPIRSYSKMVNVNQYIF